MFKDLLKFSGVIATIVVTSHAADWVWENYLEDNLKTLKDKLAKSNKPNKQKES